MAEACGTCRQIFVRPSHEGRINDADIQCTKRGGLILPPPSVEKWPPYFSIVVLAILYLADVAHEPLDPGGVEYSTHYLGIFLEPAQRLQGFYQRLAFGQPVTDQDQARTHHLAPVLANVILRIFRRLELALPWSRMCGNQINE